MKDRQQNSFEKIYEVIRRIPKGRVASYGQIAELAGNKRWARVVGYALHAVSEEMDIPWHRVVTKEGRLFRDGQTDAPGLQRELLEAEGVEFIGENVDMEHYQWRKRLF